MVPGQSLVPLWSVAGQLLVVLYYTLHPRGVNFLLATPVVAPVIAAALS